MSRATMPEHTNSGTVTSFRRSWLRKLPLRLSVRTTMLTVLVAGLGLAWIVHRAHVQRDAIAAIQACGGQVTYDWQLKKLPNGNSQLDPKGRPHGPAWLVGFLGPDFLNHVERVHLGPTNRNEVLKQVGQLDKVRLITFRAGVDILKLASAGMNALPNSGLARLQRMADLVTTELSPEPIQGANLKYVKHFTQLERIDLPEDSSVTDADLANFAGLRALSFMGVHDPQITDAGLISLEGMTRLKTLLLSRTQVSAAGLKSLRIMTQLDRLNLSQTRVDDLTSISHLARLTDLNLSLTPIDDGGLASISGLVGLNVLDLRGTNVTAQAASYLARLPKLTILSLARTRVDDAGSEHLAELGALSVLNLTDTRISDVAVGHLAKLPRLTQLCLAGTQITDRGLEKLAACKTLRVLEVRGTKITREGLKAFQTVRPGLEVTDYRDRTKSKPRVISR
jgi:hypothetical protein